MHTHVETCIILWLGRWVAIPELDPTNANPDQIKYIFENKIYAR